jgi:ATP-binding cassette, subfamily F, member 3
VRDGRVAPFDGDLDDYRTLVLAAGRRDPKAGSDPMLGRPGSGAGGGNRTVESDAAAPRQGSRQAQKRAEAESRQARHVRRKPLAERLATLDREIATLAREKADADAWLAGADAYAEANRDRLKATIARQGDVGSRLARLEAEWLELAEAIERIDAGDT